MSTEMSQCFRFPSKVEDDGESKKERKNVTIVELKLIKLIFMSCKINYN